ncbi:MAG: hypothetical protein IRZ05_09290 [Micromonosporaceae bacterium]|jgi:hypothetical protein|nr:hypothetical protein [Micromonosporaceae bacterium]
MQLIDNDVTRRALAWATRLPRLKRRALVLAMLIVCLGAAPIALGDLDGAQTAARTTAAESSLGSEAVSRSDEAASRSRTRTAPAAAPSTTQHTPGRQPEASRPTAAKSKAPLPVNPPPAAGLTQTQMNHAKTIVVVGKQMKLPERAYVIAVATAMQETNLYNLANPGLPASLQIPNDGIGYDHDSVGLFQQRPASGWGSVSELMNPAVAARKFYQALVRIPGWDKLPLTVAAQLVQGSAFPTAYAKHQTRAEIVVSRLRDY